MEPETHTYKAVDGCDIRADVFLPSGARHPTPAIVWLHGGALVCGSRKAIDRRQLARYLDEGYAVFAVDYRLAPETKLPEITEDLRDAFAWVRSEGPRLFGIDPERVAAVGQSAGGYLALASGHQVSPPPRAIVSFYGYCDILGDWYTMPYPSYLAPEHQFTREEALTAVGDKPVSEDDGRHFRFYVYARRHGLWAEAVCGDLGPEQLASYCPVRNATPDYPPTLLLHGETDSDVPYEQSVTMAEALAAAGVEHELITGPGREHGFDVVVDDPVAVWAFESAVRFLNRHLR